MTESVGGSDGSCGLPEPPFLRHLLVQIPLLSFLSRHSFIVGRQSKYGPGPLIWTQETVRVGARRNVAGVQGSQVLTDQLEREVLVRPRFFGVFVQVHDGPSNAAVLQGLLTHAWKLQRRNSPVKLSLRP